MRTKIIFGIFSFLLIFLSSCVSNKKKKEKSLNHHWNILCNEVSLNKSDTIYNCCTESISILESQTGILSNTHGTFFGKLYFTKRDWEKWNSWIQYNKGVVENLEANKDNLEYHWKQLSNAVNKNPKDTIYNCCTYSIKIMERKSNIMSDADGATFGKLYFTKNDWLKWKAWMDEDKK
jgi:hypothetical protein